MDFPQPQPTPPRGINIIRRDDIPQLIPPKLPPVPVMRPIDSRPVYREVESFPKPSALKEQAPVPMEIQEYKREARSVTPPTEAELQSLNRMVTYNPDKSKVVQPLNGQTQEQAYPISFEKITKMAVEKTLFNEECYYVKAQIASGEYHNIAYSIPEAVKVRLAWNKEDRKRKEEYGEGKFKAHYIWAVINPSPHITFQTLQHVLTKYLTHKELSWVAYSYEQRSTNPNRWGGFHLNLLVLVGDEKPSRIITCIHNAFDSIVGNKRHVYTRKVPVDQGVNLILYMKGCKKDDTGRKAAQTANDKLFREFYGLKDVYTFNPANLLSVPNPDTIQCPDDMTEIPSYEDNIPDFIRGPVDESQTSQSPLPTPSKIKFNILK